MPMLTSDQCMDIGSFTFVTKGKSVFFIALVNTWHGLILVSKRFLTSDDNCSTRPYLSVVLI